MAETDNEMKIWRMVVAGIVAICCLLVLMYLSSGYNLRKMADKQLCYQPVQLQNTMPAWAWGKCK